MNMKMISLFRVSTAKWTVIFSWKFFLPALLLMSVSCSGFGQAPTPLPVVFDSPIAEINTISLFFKEGCHFGGAIDIEGDLLVVGAPCWGRPPGEGAGAVYVLRKSTGGDLVQEAALTASDRDDGFQYDQHFGMSVVLISETMIAIGVPGYDDPQIGDNMGAVYIFEFDGSTWVETGKLIPSQPKPGAKIGTTIAFDGNLLAASGAPQAGSVVTFQREGKGAWRELTQVPVFPSADGEPYDVRIDLYGNTLALSTVFQKPLQDPVDENALIQSLKNNRFRHPF